MTAADISHYRIVRKLGSGGMGDVFLAEDTRLGRKVALKMLPEHSAGSGPARQRLINEAKTAAALDHPNICSVYDVGEAGDQVFVVMQYLDGQSLAERIREHALAPAEVVEIGVQAAQALEAAHAAGVIHRDIKPPNLIVTPQGQVKVLDFGLAMLARREGGDAETMERLTLAGSVVGTPGYMSPEQLRGRNVDARSDIFSLGATLYECAAGRPAFEPGPPIEVAMRVLSDTPASPSALNPAVPPGLDAVIARAMAKDPAARYESARALRADLVGLLDRRGPAPGLLDRRGPTPGVQAAATVETRARKRSFAATAVTAAAILAAVVAAWFASGRFRRGPDPPPREAVVWYDRGAADIREGAYFQASKALERALTIDGRFALARVRRAEAIAEMGFTDAAREELLDAIALIPDRSALPATESDYMDAVAATLRRDFQGAIDKYTRIAAAASGGDRAAAHVDLGRAFEKNDDLVRALAAYEKATGLDPQSAAAFLRAGILYGRRQQLAEASSAFSKAEEIYQAMSSQEGLAEVEYQRGSLFARLRKLPEAKEQLERSLVRSREASSEYQAIRTSLQLSNVYYASGDAVKAKSLATGAVEAAQRLDSRPLAANGLIDLAYTLLARGEFAETRAYLRQAHDLARQDKSPRLEARARLALGSLSTQEGSFDEAVSHLQAALAFYQRAGYRAETSNALILLGRVYRDKGEYAVAMKAFTEQLALAKQSSDPARLAATHSSLGILLGDYQELHPDALPHFDESYRINTSLGARVSIGWDQVNRAASFAVLGRYDDARTALAEARGIASAPEAGFRRQLASIELVDAQIALSLTQRAEAATRATEALRLAGGDYPDTALVATQTLALSRAAPGAAQAAVTLVEEAVVAARASKVPRLLSTALLASAEVRLAAGDGSGALADARAAQPMFAAAAQRESEWRAWLVSARAQQLAGDRSGARADAVRAEATRAALQARWGDEAYRHYARRPDIRIRLQQLGQLLRHGANVQRTGGD